MTDSVLVEVPGFDRIRVPLETERVTIGVDEAGVVVLPPQTGASRAHAALVRHAGGWTVRDLGSVIGTLVNGERVRGERALRPGDEISIGTAHIRFAATEQTRTGVADPLPRLTTRERDVLAALCRPMLAGDLFTEPSSIADVAGMLSVSPAAVKQHLARLFDKFSIHVEPGRRRAALANAAVRRGAVGLDDLRRI